MTDLTVPPTIKLSHAMPVLNELEQRGYNLENLFAKFGIKTMVQGADVGDTVLTAADFSRLYGYACRLLESAISGRPDNSTISKEAREILCHYLVTSHTLREAIERAVIYCRVAGPVVGDVLELTDGGDTATLQIRVPSRRQNNASLLVCMSTMNMLHQLFSWLSGRSLRLTALMLSYPEPDTTFMPGSLASQPLHWLADCDALVFKATDLNLPVMRTVEELEQVIDYFPFDVQRCTGQLQTFSGTLRTLLTSALQNNLPPMSCEAAAQLLHVSGATLRRKLSKEGHSFTTILKACQREQALHLLKNTDMSIAGIAAQLGYSDDRAFRRAFRGWTGLSPSKCRNQ